MSTAEVWRRIPSFSDYEASSLGRIRSFRRKNVRIMKPSPSSSGYLVVCLRADRPRGKATLSVHSLVAEAFYGPRPEGLECRHLNGNGTDNRADNLEYATHSENLRDKARHGTDAQAAKTHCPKRHRYDEANTYRYKTGWRACRACNRERQRVLRTASALRAASVPTERAA
jgi:hypothetical protein